VRCSLLTLSSYLDKELDAERVGEVDAHIIGCARCRTALGYLQEESHRIGGLARAHVSEQAAQQLFVQLGLIEPEEILPAEAVIHVPPHPATEPPPWLGEATGKALPWAPRRPVPTGVPALPIDDIEVPAEPMPAHTREAFDAFEIHDQGWPAEPVPAQPRSDDDAFEIHDQHVPPRETSLPEPAPDRHVELPGYAARPSMPPLPPVIGPPQPAARSAMPGFIHRLRDAISLRIALMRSPAVVDDDSVNIFDGEPATAAPQPTTGEDALARRLGQYGGASASATTSTSRQTATAVMDAPPRIDHDAPSHDAPSYDAPSYDAPSRAVPSYDAPSYETPSFSSPPAHPLAPPQPPAPPRPARPGRHLRSLDSGRGFTKPSWLSFAPLTKRTQSMSMGGPAVGVPARDSRLWIFGAAVVILMLIGLLVGKSVSSLPQATSQPQSSFHPSTVPSAPAGQPSLAPATATPATAAPTPAPTAALPPSPAVLTGAQTLGNNASGYQILDVRYGTHPADFRIVFDMGNTSPKATGAPKVIMGFGNATTFYVEFFRVIPAGSIPQPQAGNTVTSVRLLSPTPLPGRTIYQFTLAHGVTLSGYYLAGPTRLVIDLNS
jgi:hypothetical protein